MFGIDNTGVINQRQSPAIWQSDIADFPANYILGRILIDTFQGGIYIDTASSRMQISNGANNFVNGLSNIGGSPGTNNVGLGGELLDDTNILLDGHTITFYGSTQATVMRASGFFRNDSTGWALPAMDTDPLGAIVPNCKLLFFDPGTTKVYEVLAYQQP